MLNQNLKKCNGFLTMSKTSFNVYVTPNFSRFALVQYDQPGRVVSYTVCVVCDDGARRNGPQLSARIKLPSEI